MVTVMPSLYVNAFPKTASPLGADRVAVGVGRAVAAADTGGVVPAVGLAVVGTAALYRCWGRWPSSRGSGRPIRALRWLVSGGAACSSAADWPQH